MSNTNDWALVLAILVVIAFQALGPAVARADSTARAIHPGMYSRLLLSRDVERISVGNPRVLQVDVLSSREVLALGKTIGATNVLLWYTDGSTDEMRWTVSRDLSLLEDVLRDIHPDIRVESAPYRDAIILRGTVPNVRYARLAEAAASNYVRANRARPGERGSLLLPGDGSAGPGSGGEVLDSAALQGIGGRQSAPISRGASIINLIQVGELPATLEQRILDAARRLGGEKMTVRRIVRGQIPDDEVDTFVIEGEVDCQVDLSRILIAVSTLVTGGESRGISVLTDEAGALAGGGGITGGGGGGSRSGGGGGGGSGRTTGSSGLRSNRIASNIARATALSMADGRILAFVEVRDLPQVRVQVRVFEVNRTKLKDWLPQINTAKVDQSQTNQPPLLPGAGPDSPDLSPDYGGTSYQMATRLLAGAATSQWQVVAGDFAIDIFMSFLESEGVARSLARPTLVVLSGESAVFNVGGSIPVDRTFTTSAGNQNFNDVFFQDFGITLSVRPMVGDDDVITLDVNPDISFPDPGLTQALDETTSGGVSTAAFETRTLSTTTRLADGATLAIGGLLQQQQSVDSSYTPKIHEIPGAGWMAKSLSRSGDETEVVIMLSPRIMREPIPGANLRAYPEAAELLPSQAEAQPEEATSS